MSIAAAHAAAFINWSSPRAVGYDVSAVEVQSAVEYHIAARQRGAKL